MPNQRKPKKHFDEMQVQVRNNAGNQSFFILYLSSRGEKTPTSVGGEMNRRHQNNARTVVPFSFRPW